MGDGRADLRVWRTGRGNLRENREDPVPTVGVAGMALRVVLRAKYRPFLPRRHAHTMHPACRTLMGDLRFSQRRGTPRRYGLREFEWRD